MAVTGRWFQTPAVMKPAGVRVTLMDRIRRRRYEKKHPIPRLMYVDYERPVYPSGK